MTPSCVTRNKDYFIGRETAAVWLVGTADSVTRLVNCCSEIILIRNERPRWILSVRLRLSALLQTHTAAQSEAQIETSPH